MKSMQIRQKFFDFFVKKPPLKKHNKIGLFLVICLIYSTLALAKQKAGDLLEQGLRNCDIQKLAAFYSFLEEHNFKDFDYSKYAEKFFKCGAEATKLWVEKGDGKNPVDLEKNIREFFPNFFYRAFTENNAGAVEELLKHSDQETIQKIFEADDNGGRIGFGQKNYSCPLKFFELFVKHGASIKDRMILTRSAFKYDASKIKKLIELGADVNEVDSKGNTAIAELFTGLFFSDSNMRILKELLRHNPDLSIKNDEGKTVMDLAQEQIEKNCSEKSENSSLNKFAEAMAYLKRYQEEQDKKSTKN